MTTNIDNRPGFLNVHEVARLLNCSPRSVYNWISQGTIPYRKAGRRVLFDEAEELCRQAPHKCQSHFCGQLRLAATQI